ncbi:GNAT family N-acetyltransferase [Brevibacillus panacihumi]|uniref:GNAT family N-acetyltransferase n=1 Tax=Brevibacillus panacihumi TaxID=497735 RepID=UPI003D074B9F
MQELIVAKDYKHNDALRKSFSDLASQIFGIHFEEWYQKGFWDERYIPYSLVQGDQVIANVSVNLLSFLINGEKKKAIQIGTVMTHPDFRKRGLSAKLMNLVLAEYENQYDFMYLFANDTVLNFYPKFGFQPVEEHQFSMPFTPGPIKNHTRIRKLDINQAEDLDLIAQYAAQRVPVSERFGTDNCPGIFMFYALYVFSQELYYLEEEGVIVIYKQEGDCLHLYDWLSKQKISIHALLRKLAGPETKKIVFHFTPDEEGLETESESLNTGLFVKTNGEIPYPVHVKHPMTSIA